MRQRLNIPVGHRHNMLTVIGERFTVRDDAHNRNRFYYPCQCDCGNTVTVRSDGLSGKWAYKYVSCGCHSRQQWVGKEPPNRTHGDWHTRLYSTWCKMRARCEGRDLTGRKYYQPKGITVCPEWADYLTFREWALANGYNDTLTIDRIDNDKGYSPDNCRWATHTEQANNKTDNVILTAWGESKSMADWSRDKRCAITYDALRTRRIKHPDTPHEQLISGLSLGA